MKTPTDKTEALKLLNYLREDFRMLAQDEWIPDEDSINASIEVLDALTKFVETLHGEQGA